MDAHRKMVDELERQLSALADNGATEELVHSIEHMLLDNPELQDIYWSWMDVHIVLGAERCAILGESSESKSLGKLTLDPARRADLVESARRRRRNWFIGSLLGIAGCVIFGLFALPTQFPWPGENGRDILPGAEQPIAESSWRIPQITRVSWEGPIFANRSTVNFPPSVPQIGLVDLELSGGQSVSGYVLGLSPGDTVELMLAIDAIAENNCSLIEIDSQGTPVRRVVSFNNIQPETDPNTRRLGLRGTWAAKNDTDKPQYYLINAIHKRYHPSSPTADRQESFYLSDMRLIIDEPDLVVIGWDDGGLSSSEFHGDVQSDGSFDDLTVLIRHRGPGISAPPLTASYRKRGWISPRVHSRPLGAPQTDGFERYRFSVQPGEMVVLNVGSEAKALNALYVIDEDSDSVLWSVNNAGLESNHLGAVVLENSGTEALNLAVFGECLPPANDSGVEVRPDDWACCEILKVHGQPNCAILGFRDRVRKGEFVDLRVTLMTMSPPLSGLFDDLQPE